MLLLLFMLPLCAVAQTKSISGVVKDSKGDPVPNATVLVKGSKSGVEVSTTMAFVRLLRNLLRDKNMGKHVVPIIPDNPKAWPRALVTSIFPPV